MCLVRCKSGRAVGLPTYAYALGIVLALPGCRRESPGERQRDPEAERADASGSVAAAVVVAPHALPQPATGRSSFIVLLDAPAAALEATLASATIEKLRAGSLVKVERRAAADVSLPRPEALATVAATLRGSRSGRACGR